jgi:Tfp pilus assembly protein PilP
VSFAAPVARGDDFPAEAKAREARLLAKASPAVRAWVRQEGRRVAKAGPVDQQTVTVAVRQRFGTLGSLGDGDIMAIAFLVMMEASRSAEEDLKAIMDRVKRVNAEKQQQRAALEQAHGLRTSEYAATNTVAAPQRMPATPPAAGRTEKVREAAARPDSVGDLGQIEQLRLQQVMDRRSKMAETLSNIMKKMSDTQSSIIGNLK